MSVWLLETTDHKDCPIGKGYSEMIECVVVASNEPDARKCASDWDKYGFPSAWLNPEFTSCKLLDITDHGPILVCSAISVPG